MLECLTIFAFRDLYNCMASTLFLYVLVISIWTGEGEHLIEMYDANSPWLEGAL